VIVVHSSRFVEHTPPPGHPERPERAEVFDEVVRRWCQRGGEVHEPRAATVEELERVHTRRYVEDMLARAGRPTMIDGDTYTSPESIDVALLAAGGTIDAARLARERSGPVLVLPRPPGHHAEPDRAMGFCLFNNVALAAAAARADGVPRVAVVDFDVHHGNGTQAAFYDDATVFFASSHQFPYYPGTGAADERGRGQGLGTTVNVPLPAGTRDDRFVDAWASAIIPALEAFEPGLLLVSAGFDAHHLDPLGGLRVTTDGFRQVMTLIDEASRRLCGRRAVWVVEGGYHLGALAECLEAAVDVLS
jgi:acetoin utilization deacetylase AcuC-like enzyme